MVMQHGMREFVVKLVIRQKLIDPILYKGFGQDLVDTWTLSGICGQKFVDELLKFVTVPQGDRTESALLDFGLEQKLVWCFEGQA